MILKKIYMWIYKLNKKNIGKNVFISPTTKIIGSPKIDDKVTIHSRCLIERRENSYLEIGEGTEMNVNSQISSSGKVIIGKNVLFGPNVYVTDSTHHYGDISIPISSQGIVSKGEVVIGDESWLGRNVVVVGNVKVGRHCVIGASTVITKDIPDYCVVVGNPGRIIKKYNKEINKWENI